MVLVLKKLKFDILKKYDRLGVELLEFDDLDGGKIKVYRILKVSKITKSLCDGEEIRRISKKCSFLIRISYALYLSCLSDEVTSS